MDEGEAGNAERWGRMEDLYHAALPLSATERVAFVAEVCAGDVTLRDEVTSLLAADNSAADFLQETVFTLGLEILADESLRNTEVVLDSTRPTPAEQMTGTLVGGRYKIVGRLGGGGMGDVYLALDKPEMLRRRVVIKVLKEERLKDEWVVTKFQQEAEALTKIDDPGIAGILDVGTLPEGKPYLVMQYVEGQDLRSYLKEKQEQQKEIEIEEVAEIIRQAGRTLDVAHRSGIVHRDLKPENIMIRRNASGELQVKVIDFGIAKVKNSVLAPSTATAHIAGTWQYMSPEQLRREKATALSDVYTLGVIAYELLTGRRPFSAKTPVHLAELQKEGVKVMPQDVCPDFLSDTAQQAILKALSYRLAARYKSAREFSDELARALSEPDEEIVQPPVATFVDLEASTRERGGQKVGTDEKASLLQTEIGNQPLPPSAPPIHRRWLTAAVAALLIGLLSLALWRAFRSPQSPAPPAQTQAGPAEELRPERKLTYWLLIESVRKKGGWVKTVGDENYSTGDAFKLMFQPTQSGALYLFNEGLRADGKIEWNLLFPTPETHKSDSRVAANETLVGTNKNFFTGQPGAETIWIIWAKQPVPWIEKIVESSIKTNLVVSDTEQLNALRDFTRASPRNEGVPDNSKQEITLAGRGDVLLGAKTISHKDPQ